MNFYNSYYKISTGLTAPTTFDFSIQIFGLTKTSIHSLVSESFLLTCKISKRSLLKFFNFTRMNASIKNIVVIGDRVLLKPLAEANTTGSGLYLPPSVKEGNAVHTGIVIKTGPGYPIPANQDPDQFLKEAAEAVNYVPLQVKEGDQALYLHAAGHEIEVNHERYIILPQNAILMVFRDDIENALKEL